MRIFFLTLAALVFCVEFYALTYIASAKHERVPIVVDHINQLKYEKEAPCQVFFRYNDLVQNVGFPDDLCGGWIVGMTGTADLITGRIPFLYDQRLAEVRH